MSDTLIRACSEEIDRRENSVALLVSDDNVRAVSRCICGAALSRKRARFPQCAPRSIYNAWETYNANVLDLGLSGVCLGKAAARSIESRTQAALPSSSPRGASPEPAAKRRLWELRAVPVGSRAISRRSLIVLSVSDRVTLPLRSSL